MQQDERYARARKRVEQLKGFYIHLAVYLVVNIGLFAINMITSPGTLWFYWAAIGWGIAVAIQGATVMFGPFGDDWTERKVQRIIDRDRAAEPVRETVEPTPIPDTQAPGPVIS
jgi:hypothetical protein